MYIGDKLQSADGQRGRETEILKGNRTLLPTLTILSCIAEVPLCHLKNVNNVFRQKVMFWFTCGFFSITIKINTTHFSDRMHVPTQLPSLCSWPEVIIFTLVPPRKCSMRNFPSSSCQVLLLKVLVATPFVQTGQRQYPYLSLENLFFCKYPST